ncbi:tRNA methyl transferase [Toxoplasma gondii VAND]|uniref:tRNA-5-taurinomethyluridine 2-sulfurtransferase n=1 Tax=Toxoplasma gondii VAND TaxID=933077 RepID=A0A086QBX8_TOXGO|nr:tRNA methyl transferase [Toxoplasma gondii VAND]
MFLSSLGGCKSLSAVLFLLLFVLAPRQASPLATSVASAAGSSAWLPAALPRSSGVRPPDQSRRLGRSAPRGNADNLQQLPSQNGVRWRRSVSWARGLPALFRAAADEGTEGGTWSDPREDDACSLLPSSHRPSWQLRGDAAGASLNEKSGKTRRRSGSHPWVRSAAKRRFPRWTYTSLSHHRGVPCASLLPHRCGFCPSSSFLNSARFCPVIGEDTAVRGVLAGGDGVWSHVVSGSAARCDAGRPRQEKAGVAGRKRPHTAVFFISNFAPCGASTSSRDCFANSAEDRRGAPVGPPLSLSLRSLSRSSLRSLSRSSLRSSARSRSRSSLCSRSRSSLGSSLRSSARDPFSPATPLASSGSLPPRMRALLSELRRQKDLHAVFEKLVSFASSVPLYPARDASAVSSRASTASPPSPPRPVPSASLSPAPPPKATETSGRADDRLLPPAQLLQQPRREASEEADEEGDSPEAWERVAGCAALVRIRVCLRRVLSPKREGESRACSVFREADGRQEPQQGAVASLSVAASSSSGASCHDVEGAKKERRELRREDRDGEDERRRWELRVDLRGWSDSLVVRAWLAILVDGLNNAAPDTVLALSTDDILREAGLMPSSTPSGGKDHKGTVKETQGEPEKQTEEGEEGQREAEEEEEEERKGSKRESEEERLQEGEERLRGEETRKCREEEKRRLVVPQGLEFMLRSIQRQVREQLSRLAEEEKNGGAPDGKVRKSKTDRDASRDLTGETRTRTDENGVQRSVLHRCRSDAETEADSHHVSSSLSSSLPPSQPHLSSPSSSSLSSSSSPSSSSPSSSAAPDLFASTTETCEEKRELRRSAASSPPQVAVLLSGGVDSSVSLCLLQQRGFAPQAFFIKVWLPELLLVSRHLNRLLDSGLAPAAAGGCGWERDLLFADQVCRQARVPLEVLPLQEAYWEGVVQQMLDEARQGLTPNPDWWCNQRVKFGAFLDLLDGRETRFSARRIAGESEGENEKEEADMPFLRNSSRWTGAVASGHYARVVRAAETSRRSEEGEDTEDRDEDGEEDRGDKERGSEEESRTRLFRGKDRRKDQSYFLSGLSQRQLRRLVTPVGDMEKVEVRRLAAALDLPTARRQDSQGLCFLGNLSLSFFFRHFLGSSTGPVLHFPSCLALGSHDGLWNFTVGQRKGVTPCIDVARVRRLSSLPDSSLTPHGASVDSEGSEEQTARAGDSRRRQARASPGKPTKASATGQGRQAADDEERRLLEAKCHRDGDDSCVRSANHTVRGRLECTDNADRPDGRVPVLSEGNEAPSSSSCSSSAEANEGQEEGGDRQSRLSSSSFAACLSGSPQNLFEPANPFSRTGLGAASLAGRWVVAAKHPPSNALFVVSEKEMKAAAAVAESVGYSLDVLAAGPGVRTLGDSQTYLLALLLTLQQKFLRVDNIQWISHPPCAACNAEEQPVSRDPSFLDTLLGSRDPRAKLRGDEKSLETADEFAFLRWALEGSRDKRPRLYDVQVRHAAGTACAAIHRRVRLCLFPPERRSPSFLSPSAVSEESGGRRKESRAPFGPSRAETSAGSSGAWTAWIELAEPDEGLAPGQIAAIYEGEECLGAGRISARQGQMAVEAALRSAGLN